MTAIDLTQNYFELFQLPVSFEVDLNTLAERYRKLQSSIHPDKYATASDLERRLSVQQSARINDAFQTMKNPLRRARYLLQLNGIDVDAETDSRMDPQFLMQQMDLREALEFVKNSANPARDLITINTDIESTIAGIIHELKEIFDSGTALDLQSARDCVRRLQFMTRLQEEAHNLEETFF